MEEKVHDSVIKRANREGKPFLSQIWEGKQVTRKRRTSLWKDKKSASEGKGSTIWSEIEELGEPVPLV